MAFAHHIWDGVRASCSSLTRRFARDREGAAALEFAIVAPPFFIFLLAVIEIAYMFFLSVMIDNATLSSARKIRTGQMQYASASSEQFFEDVCDRIEIVAPCDGHLYLDVRTYDDFGSTRTPNPVTGDGDFDPSGLDIDFGEEGDIVLVRAYYVWDVIFPDMGTGLSNLAGGKRLIVSTVAFRNEPFGTLDSNGVTG
jgi:Flp pilus assembly protein TadG